MKLKDNINTPPVHGTSASSSRVRYMKKNIAALLEAKGMNVSNVRSGQVICVTFPADIFFSPNDTELSLQGAEALKNLEQIAGLPQLYRIVVAVHADDSGDDVYTEKLTRQRADAIKTELERMARKSSVNPNIDYYWMGNSENLVPNNSVVNRAKNRRIEFYIVPEKQAVEASRSS